MELTPFGSPCRACLSTEGKHRFCSAHCMEVAPGQFEVVERIGDALQVPHLHRACGRCGYEWLEQPLGFEGAA